jgi:DNA-binding response OmpR family regulator
LLSVAAMGQRVLIIEDDHGIQSLLAALLTRSSIESTTVGDGYGDLKMFVFV